MVTQTKFCSICNSRAFEEFNGRVDAMCSTCGSLERHRGFALALFALPITRQSRLCLLQSGDDAPEYCRYLAEYVDIHVVTPETYDQQDRKFDVAYHNHVLHTPFLGAEDYPQLLPRVDRILGPGAFQLFSVGPQTVIGNLQQKLSGPETGLRRFGPSVFGDSPALREIAVFDPAPLYGMDIFRRCMLGGVLSDNINGNTVIVSRKAN